MISLSSMRSCSSIRSILRPFISNNLEIALNHALRNHTLCFLCGFAQNLLQETFVGSNRHDADLGTLPEFLMIDLCHGNVELRSKSIFDTPDYHAFIFE